MKKSIILIGVLLVFCTGCDRVQSALPKGKESTDISVIGDRTDPLKKQPDESEVMPLYNLTDDHLYDGVRFHYRDVSDVSQTDVRSMRVQPVSPLFSNSNDRVAELRSFRDGVGETFVQARKSHNQTQNRSLVYSSVISEANYLAHSDATNRYLIIYSNMLDHCDDIDFYNPVMADLIARHPEQVMQSLERKMKIEDLTGIKVIIVYQAADHDGYGEERLFLKARDFYVALLTRHHAEVVTVPNLSMVASNKVQ